MAASEALELRRDAVSPAMARSFKSDRQEDVRISAWSWRLSPLLRVPGTSRGTFLELWSKFRGGGRFHVAFIDFFLLCLRSLWAEPQMEDPGCDSSCKRTATDRVTALAPSL